MTPEDIDRHEAGHAAACILLKIPICGFGRDPDGRGGHTKLVDFLQEDIDHNRVRDYMLMLMAGWIMEDRELPEWPPSPDAYQQDERWMRVFADHLGLTKGNWFGLCGEAYSFTTTDEFEYLWQALTGLAARRPMGVVDGSGLTLAQDIVKRFREDRAE